MNTAYNTTSIEHLGHTITIKWHYDQDMWAPWEEHEVHGPVSDWTTRDKRPGEMVLNTDGRSRRYYDFAEAVRIAKRDGWDTAPYGQGTKGERAHRAALADFERLRAWCNDEWHWTWYSVEIEGFPTYYETLGGIESDYTDEHEREAFAAAKEWLENELREREHAACCDVVTAS